MLVRPFWGWHPLVWEILDPPLNFFLCLAIIFFSSLTVYQGVRNMFDRLALAQRLQLTLQIARNPFALKNHFR